MLIEFSGLITCVDKLCSLVVWSEFHSVQKQTCRENKTRDLNCSPNSQTILSRIWVCTNKFRYQSNTSVHAELQACVNVELVGVACLI